MSYITTSRQLPQPTRYKFFEHQIAVFTQEHHITSTTSRQGDYCMVKEFLQEATNDRNTACYGQL